MSENLHGLSQSGGCGSPEANVQRNPAFSCFPVLIFPCFLCFGHVVGKRNGGRTWPVREKGGECGGFCRAVGPVGGVRGEYGFSEVLPLFPVRGGGTCPAANEKCHRENIKKEQKVEFPVPYTWGICPESGGSGSGIFFRAGHSLVFVVGGAAAGAVEVIPFCPLLHSALRKKRWVPPLRRSMSGNEIHCALSRADR